MLNFTNFSYQVENFASTDCSGTPASSFPVTLAYHDMCEPAGIGSVMLSGTCSAAVVTRYTSTNCSGQGSAYPTVDLVAGQEAGCIAAGRGSAKYVTNCPVPYAYSFGFVAQLPILMAVAGPYLYQEISRSLRCSLSAAEFEFNAKDFLQSDLGKFYSFCGFYLWVWFIIQPHVRWSTVPAVLVMDPSRFCDRFYYAVSATSSCAAQRSAHIHSYTN